MKDVVAVCNEGHRFLLEEFTSPDIPEVIADIGYCPQMVSKSEYGNLVLECGARVLWRRNAGPMPKRWFRFKSRQLDLFWDHDPPLDKSV